MSRPFLRGSWLPGVVLLGLSAAPSGALPLWELTGTGNRITVLGSIHLLRATDYPLPAAVGKALDGADILVMEIDMDDLDPAANAVTIAGLARDPRGRSLRELVGPEEWPEVSAGAKRLGIDIAALGPFEPWYAAIAVTQLRLAQLGFDPSLGVESRLTADAGRLGKEIRGLETLEGQLGVLDRLSAAAQRKFLRTTLEEAAEVDDLADGMITAWKAADLVALDRDLLAGVRDQPEVYRALIVERNEHFAATIRELARDDRDYLVVMGTLHLVGPDSVLGMLEETGIGARPIPDAGTAGD